MSKVFIVTISSGRCYKENESSTSRVILSYFQWRELNHIFKYLNSYLHSEYEVNIFLTNVFSYCVHV